MSMIHLLFSAMLFDYTVPFDQPQHLSTLPSSSQEPLIVIPRMNRPDSALIESRYRCGDTEVRLELRLIGSTVQVSGYSDANGAASVGELSLWNSWLSDIKTYNTFNVACQGGAAVIVYVFEPNPQKLRDPPYVAVFWDAGEIKRLPFNPGPSGQ